MKPIPKFKGFECGDGRLVDTAYFSGHYVGKGVLDGIIFKVMVQQDGTLKVEVTPGCKGHFEQLVDHGKLLAAALEYAGKTDLLYDFKGGYLELIPLGEANGNHRENLE